MCRVRTALVSIVRIYRCGDYTYCRCDIEVEECHAGQDAENNRHAGGEILRNVVCILDDHRDDDTA